MKKQEAEQQTKQKLEKGWRLEKMKLKHEEGQQKVLWAQEQVEQMEEEKKRQMERNLLSLMRRRGRDRRRGGQKKR